jgi:hypothetical protein
MLNYLKECSCIDCGISNPLVLEFDHIDPETKSANVSDLVMRRLSWKRVFAEIQKCVVRCANCHRIRTAVQRGWTRLAA